MKFNGLNADSNRVVDDRTRLSLSLIEKQSALIKQDLHELEAKINSNFLRTPPALTDLYTRTLEPTGFVSNGAIDIVYDSTARTITLYGDFFALWRGEIIPGIQSGWTSPVHDSAAGVYYLSYTGNGFGWSTSAWLFSDLQVAFVFYTTADKFAVRETHGTMAYSTHKNLHENIGTYLSIGGDLSGYLTGSTTAADRRPLVSLTTVMDEDLSSSITALSSASYTIRNMVTATRTFTLAQSDIVLLSGNNPYWNQLTGGNWVNTLMANNSYSALFLIAVPVTSDSGSQAYRFQWVQPQMNGSLTVAQAFTSRDLTLGETSMAISEYVFIAKIIIQYTAANWNLYSVEKLVGSKAFQSGISGSGLTSVTTDSTLSGLGTPVSPLSVVYQYPIINQASLYIPTTQNTNIAVNNPIRFSNVLSGFSDSSGNITTSPITSGAISITVNATNKTFSRVSGSFISDGLVVGMTINTSGFSNAGNNGAFLISALTATLITCSSATGLVNETSASGIVAVTGWVNILLNGGRKYKLEAYCNYTLFGATSGYLGYMWYLVSYPGAPTYTGYSGFVRAHTDTTNQNTCMPAVAVINTSSLTAGNYFTVQCRISQLSSLTQLAGGTPSSTVTPNFCIITVIA